MSGSSVPTVTFGANGFVAPSESAILAGVLADMQAAFGGNLEITSPSTPQFQLATSTAAIIADSYDQFCAMANGIDPAFASGRFQDAIGRLYFLTRNPAQATVVACTLVGNPGVFIPTGALAKAADGNLYACTGGVTIPAGGSISANFACVTTGPIACPASTLQIIYRAIPGWNTINNPADGVVGTNVESRAAFEARREASVAGNSMGAIGAILGAVAAVPGVLDYWGYNNATASPVTVNGVTIAANSVYISVTGGTNAAVAMAIFTKIAPGCAMGGNTTVTVTDPNPLYGTAPTYSITFEIPTSLRLYVAVSIPNTPGVPSNATALVQAAVQAAFNGTDGGPRARTATTLYASRFYTGVEALGAWASVITIFVGASASPSTNSVVINGDKEPTLANGDITLTLV